MYYKTYSGSNANTTDLEKVFEKMSGQNLQIFFKQWLFTPGQPSIKVDWKYDPSKKSVSLKIEQTQTNLFEFPLQVSFTDGNKTVMKSIDVKNKITQKNISMHFTPHKITVDPNVNLLFSKE
jgi:aminopeptidase N